VEHLTVTLLPVVQFTDREVDDVLDHSFPASDPPPWTTSGAETVPAAQPAPTPTLATRARVLTTVLRPVASLLGAAGVALLVPLFVVLLPLALMYRVVLELTGWPSWLRAAPVDEERRASPQHVLTGI
jgi:hypothetical protein